MPPCPALADCWLYLIRHGATENNRAKPPRLQGRRTDPGLSDVGVDQAERTSRFLADVKVERVYATPLLRSRQTARLVAESHGLEVEIVDDLIEVDVGKWEGRAWDEIERTDPEAYRAFMRDASIHPYLGGETMETVRRRVVPAFQRIMADNPARRIAVVAHNVVNRVYLTHLMGMPIRRYRAISQENCGVSLLRYRAEEVKVVTVNSVFHLSNGD